MNRNHFDRSPLKQLDIRSSLNVKCRHLNSAAVWLLNWIASILSNWMKSEAVSKRVLVDASCYNSIQARGQTKKKGIIFLNCRCMKDNPSTVHLPITLLSHWSQDKRGMRNNWIVRDKSNSLLDKIEKNFAGLGF